MNDDRRKMLTEYIGEVWVEHDNPSQQIYVGKVCIDKSTLSNRTFTTWSDLGAVMEKLVERGEWDRFYQYAYTEWKHTIVQPNSIFALVHLPQIEDVFTVWFITPDRFCELAAEFLEGRDERT